MVAPIMPIKIGEPMMRAVSQDELIARYIAPNPRHGGIANVVVVPAYIPVWALVGAVTLRGETLDEVAGDYAIPPAVVRRPRLLPAAPRRD